jgi:hypothetical protein
MVVKVDRMKDEIVMIETAEIESVQIRFIMNDRELRSAKEGQQKRV